MKNYHDDKQLVLFSDVTASKEPSKTIADFSDNKIVSVSFRDLVPQIKDTGYLTHSVYYYPAKFIPHVVRHCIESFTKEDDWVIDPFAGSGTVGLEAYLCKRNSFLLDLNPLLDHIMPVKIPEEEKELSESVLYGLLQDMQKSEIVFRPSWSNLDYWYPDKILEVLSKYWGWQKTLRKDIYSLIIESSLIKVSKHFSYAEHKAPKLFKSKKKSKYIEELLKSDWLEKLDEMIFKLASETLKSINQFIVMTKGYKKHVIFHGGIDSSRYKFDSNDNFDALVTSPPYLQAQEYIRTAKMDLYWLGYNDVNIKTLSKLEIPYRKPNRIIHTETLQKVKSVLRRRDLVQLLDSYFCHTISALENSMGRLKSNSKACIFVGSPKIDGFEVEIWKILMEYFIERGYLFEVVYEDRIKARQLFGSRKNKNPEGMESEYLLVLKKE